MEWNGMVWNTHVYIHSTRTTLLEGLQCQHCTLQWRQGEWWIGGLMGQSSKYMVDFPASHVWFQKDKQEATLETTFFSKTACPLTFARKGLRPQFTITMASNSWQDLLPSGNQTRLAGKSTNYTSCFLVSAHLWGVPSRLCLIILYDHEKSQILNYKVVYSPSQASILGISQPDT
jgi:hypothetical protein